MSVEVIEVVIGDMWGAVRGAFNDLLIPTIPIGGGTSYHKTLSPKEYRKRSTIRKAQKHARRVTRLRA